VDRKLARKNLIAAVLIGVFGMFMFGLTFVVAAIYLS
jgi:hypothetical protein